MLQAHLAHSREVSALRAGLAALETAGEQRCHELQSQYQADTVDRQLEGERHFARLRAEHETALDLTTQGLRSELDAQRLQSKAEMQSAMRQLREAHAAEMSRLRCELEQEQAQLLQVSMLQWTRHCQAHRVTHDGYGLYTHSQTMSGRRVTHDCYGPLFPQSALLQLFVPGSHTGG